jgi:alginate O-acetyltransferase complex protein AlgJ
MERAEPRLSREEIAKREIGRTDISPPLAKAMVAVFLATILAVPTIQSIHEILGAGRSARNSRLPGWCSIASAFSGVHESYRETGGGQSARILAANARLLKNITEFERRLEDESFLTEWLLGPTQYWLARLGGLGNEKAYIGRDRWLFYRPGVEYVTGPGFLEPAVLARRASGGNEYTVAPQPDPRPAILAFQRQLARSGVRLILVPTPDKAMVEHDRFSSRFQGTLAVLQNRSYDRFKAEMEAAGVLVFDCAAILFERKQQSGQPQFLITDTHWTPDAMQAIAKRLGEFLTAHVALPERGASAFGSRVLRVRNLGDIAMMLQLPPDQELFRKEEVTVRQVVDKGGTPWQSEEDADVMLLGDSFTNIYSMAEMNWGEAAGFAEQLSFTMKRSIDRISRNDAGAYATRQALALDLARGKNRLTNKRVLIWQFAIRELAVGDWKGLTWNEPRPEEAEPPHSPVGHDSIRSPVRGRVKAISAAPVPGSVPYRDAILAVHLEKVEWPSSVAPAAEAEVVVYLWGMRDNRLTAAARYLPGQSVTLRLTPWERAQARYGRFTRVELDDPEFKLIDLPTYWADEFP